jgi:hypothetical protein
MQSLSSFKPLLAAAVALGALAAGSAAHARSDVVVSIGVHAPFGYVQPAPVYVHPQPVYVQPRPVYVQPQPVYVQPRPVYYGHGRGHGHGHAYGRHAAWGDADRDGVPNIHDRDSRFDADRDGVPNRYDRAPRNPHRR